MHRLRTEGWKSAFAELSGIHLNKIVLEDVGQVECNET